MKRVIGNSPERVELADLQDVIYYRQLKEFSDQQFENSKDLRRALSKGHVIVVEQTKVSQGSGEIEGHLLIEPPKSVSINDLKIALREILPEIKENKNNSQGISEISLKNAIREIAPLIVDMVRQEVSKIGISKVEDEKRSEVKSRGFQEPTYVPDISDFGLKSNIRVKGQETSSDTMTDALKALKQLKGK
jgi:hypothetical protein